MRTYLRGGLILGTVFGYFGVVLFCFGILCVLIRTFVVISLEWACKLFMIIVVNEFSKWKKKFYQLNFAFVFC